MTEATVECMRCKNKADVLDKKDNEPICAACWCKKHSAKIGKRRNMSEAAKKPIDKPASILVDTGVSEEYLNELMQLRRYQMSALAELDRFLRKHGKIVKSPQ